MRKYITQTYFTVSKYGSIASFIYIYNNSVNNSVDECMKKVIYDLRPYCSPQHFLEFIDTKQVWIAIIAVFGSL